jgi:Ring finger domain
MNKRILKKNGFFMMRIFALFVTMAAAWWTPETGGVEIAMSLSTRAGPTAALEFVPTIGTTHLRQRQLQQQQQTNTPTTPKNSNNSLKKAMIWVSILLGSLILMTIMTYFFSIVVDWYNRWMGLTDTPVPPYLVDPRTGTVTSRDALARATGLSGMTAAERQLILSHVFGKAESTEQQDNSASKAAPAAVPPVNASASSTTVMVEMVPVAPPSLTIYTWRFNAAEVARRRRPTTQETATTTVEETAAATTEVPPEQPPSATILRGTMNESLALDDPTTENAPDAAALAPQNGLVTITVNEADQEKVCCICLSEYLPDDWIISGDCHHMMHRKCCLQWLTKQDHCPYCRKFMMEPNVFGQAAETVLGAQRVAELRLANKQE